MVLYQKISLVALFFILAGSCGIVNEDEVFVPGYVYVPSFTYETNPDNSQGSNSQAFNDMWFSEGGTALGALGMPSLIPIQKSGPTEITIEAGISNTGQDNSRLAYPFVAAYTQVINLKPGVIDTVRPVFKYLAGTGFKFIEDYDRITRAFEFNTKVDGAYVEGDTILLVKDTTNSWSNNTYCGKIVMPSTQRRSQLITKELYELDGAGAPAFIEIDYKTNVPLDIGYYYFEPNNSGGGSTSVNNPVVYAYPNEKWKKLYVDLTGEVSSRKVGTKYYIYIGIDNGDFITPEVYIDNVKLVYFK